MELFKILEVSIYVILDFLPSLFLAIIPFRDHMYFNLKINFIIITILYFLIVSCKIIGMQNVETAAFFSVVLLFIYLIFYILCFRIEIVKLLFVLIIIVNYGSFTAITYSFFTTYFRYGYQDKAYSIRSSGILCLILLISYPFMVYLMQKKIKPLIASQVNNKVWNYLWLVPATFCLSYYYNLFSNGGFTGYTTKVSNIIYAAFYNIGGLFATFLVAKLVKDSNDSLQLRAENYMLNLQTIQYEHMKNRIEETRRAKHDLRQTIAIMQIFLKDNDTEKLKNYIVEYINSIPPDTIIKYCENYSLNAVLVYYGDIANKNSIKFQVEINDLSALYLSDADLVILFGNLLENAIEACLRQVNGKAFIILKVQTVNNSIVITLINSYNGLIKKFGNQFVSSKKNRIGIGISSIVKIVEKYQGIHKFEYDDLVFNVSILFNNILYNK